MEIEEFLASINSLGWFLSNLYSQILFYYDIQNNRLIPIIIIMDSIITVKLIGWMSNAGDYLKSIMAVLDIGFTVVN